MDTLRDTTDAALALLTDDEVVQGYRAFRDEVVAPTMPQYRDVIVTLLNTYADELRFRGIPVH
jgi:hypothetical protein